MKAVEIPRPESVVPPDAQQSQDISDQSVVSRTAAKLVLQRGGRVGKEFVITGIETNIGRWDADSGIFPDIDLDEDDPEAKISRRHARIVNHNGQFFIEDLGSTNGIEFAGSRVDNKPIEEGDVYQLCDYELRFTYR